MNDDVHSLHQKRKDFSISLNTLLHRLHEHKASIEEIIHFAASAEQPSNKALWYGSKAEQLVREIIELSESIVTLPESESAPIDELDAYGMLITKDEPPVKSLPLTEEKKKVLDEIRGVVPKVTPIGEPKRFSETKRPMNKDELVSALVDSVSNMEPSEHIKHAKDFWRKEYASMDEDQLRNEYTGIFDDEPVIIDEHRTCSGHSYTWDSFQEFYQCVFCGHSVKGVVR